jgi:hypothetical protein
MGLNIGENILLLIYILENRKKLYIYSHAKITHTQKNETTTSTINHITAPHKYTQTSFIPTSYYNPITFLVLLQNYSISIVTSISHPLVYHEIFSTSFLT